MSVPPVERQGISVSCTRDGVPETCKRKTRDFEPVNRLWVPFTPSVKTPVKGIQRRFTVKKSLRTDCSKYFILVHI